jgi:hypothetical protein
VTDLPPEETLDLADARPPATPAAFREGDVFAGAYQIVEFVARGGFSHVFKAREIATGNFVALKFQSALDGGSNPLERMQRELRLARDLRHPNIVHVFELIESQGFRCLCMEFVEGRTLKTLIVEDHPLAIPEAIRILLKLTSAMAAVHAAGVIHRDLKPQNVIVGVGGLVKLLDFGLAKTPMSTGLTAAGTILGTPDYMSPEQVEGKEASARSDIYSLGVIGWELLAGRPPFRGDTALATAIQHVRARVPDPREVRPGTPDELARLLMRLTESHPSRRPASAQEVLVELDRIASGASASVRRSPRIPIRMAAVAALVAVAILGGAWFFTRRAPVASQMGPRDVVHVVVVPGAASASDEQVLVALAEAVGTRLSGPTVQVHTVGDAQARQAALRPTLLAATGVQHVLRLSLDRKVEPSGTFRYELNGEIFTTSDGRLWKRLENRLAENLDFLTVDGISKKIATEYQQQIDTARSVPTRP